MMDKSSFNIIDDVVRIPWTKLKKEERLEKLNDFFNRTHNISEDVKNMLVEKVNNDELKLKKEVDYDEINKKIKKLHFLLFDKKSNSYSYKPKEMNKAEKSRKSAKNKLFRK